MQTGRTSDVLVLAEQEEADAVVRPLDVDPLVWRGEPPLPWPPIPPLAKSGDIAG